MIDKRKWEIVVTETKSTKKKTDKSKEEGGEKEVQQALQFQGR
jgi:hypothetical protein